MRNPQQGTGARRGGGFHVMAKPSGPICNLACTYCFYLRKQAMFGSEHGYRMSPEVLDAFVRQYIDAHEGREVVFAWQGGEPTLMGLQFFEEVLAVQQKHKRENVTISNSLQTNGTLLDDKWCQFLHRNKFLVGLSIDGPETLHDANRVDKAGKPTGSKVVAALRLLQKHRVEFNVLCVVNNTNSRRPRDVYRFLRELDVQHIQFIPAVEHLGDGKVTDWTVPAEQYGSFMCGVFNEWVKRDVGRVYVQQFEVALEAFCGMDPSICVHAPTCGGAVAIEHQGDIFSCDHFVYPQNRLGNVLTGDLSRMVESSFQRKFGADKQDKLPTVCKICPYLRACNGGCPKDRFISTADGEEGLNYLCAGYYKFFSHVRRPMTLMASLLKEKRAPAEVMKMV